MSLYRNGDTYVYITSQSPKGFDGVLFVAFEGTSPATMHECVVPPGKVQGWEMVPLTNEWRSVFGLPFVPEPDPPRPKRKRRRRRRKHAPTPAPAPAPAPDPPTPRRQGMSKKAKSYCQAMAAAFLYTAMWPTAVWLASLPQTQAVEDSREAERQALEEKTEEFSEDSFDFPSPECMLEV